MNIFSFDKYWGLDWNKLDNGIYECNVGSYVCQADKSNSTNPKFSIFAHDDSSVRKCLADRLEEDTFIMQVKSIRTNGKIINSQVTNRK